MMRTPLGLFTRLMTPVTFACQSSQTKGEGSNSYLMYETYCNNSGGYILLIDVIYDYIHLLSLSISWIYIAIDIIINKKTSATIVHNNKMDLPPIQPQNTMKRSSNSPDKKKPNGGDYDAPSPPSPTRRRASFEAASVLANLGLSSSRDAASPTIATTTTTATDDDSKLPSTNSTSTKHKYKSSPPRNDVPMTFPEKVGLYNKY